jgi:hypothetical protein
MPALPVTAGRLMPEVPSWRLTLIKDPGTGSSALFAAHGEIQIAVRQTGTVSAAEGRRVLGPLRSRTSWVASGLILQAAGAGGAAAYVWRSARRQDIGGRVSAATIRLAWHGEMHTRQGLAVLAAGVFIYAAGSVLMARPYVTRPVTLFVAVPLAAVAGMLVLGVLAFIVALLVAALENGDLGFGLDIGGDRRRLKRPRRP